MTHRSIDDFRAHVTKAAAVYHRIDNGHLTGRNSTATDAALDWHVARAKEILAAAVLDDSDPLPEYLDSTNGARLEAKWNRLERRYHGLSTERGF